MVTADGFTRWSQVVRSPGAVTVYASAPIEVPPIGGATPENPARPGVRLITMPVADGPQHYVIDVVSTQAQAMLEGFLANGLHVGKRLSWRSKGYGVLRKDTIRISSRG